VGIKIKSAKEIALMQEGGEILARIKRKLAKKIVVGVSAIEIDRLAEELVKKAGGEPSFKMVRNYNWTTCVNVNKGVVHGIPKKNIIFSKGDIVSVDIGLFYKGFHTDTSISVLVGNEDEEKKRMLKAGDETLSEAIKKVKPGSRVFDISRTIERSLTNYGYYPIRALVGHGVGRELHEEPQIPCFTTGKRGDSPKIPAGAVLAIEVMYTMGNPDVVLEDDGWTISTADGKISALFEETVAVTKNGPVVLTDQ
jgi:methionyl aminopeptidase